MRKRSEIAQEAAKIGGERIYLKLILETVLDIRDLLNDK